MPDSTGPAPHRSRLRRSLATFKRMGTIGSFRDRFIGGMLELGVRVEDLQNPLHRGLFILRRARVAGRMLEYYTRAQMAPLAW